MYQIDTSVIVLEYPDVFVTVVSTVVILDSFLSDVIVSAVSVTTTSGGGFAIGVDATRLVEDCILQKKKYVYFIRRRIVV